MEAPGIEKKALEFGFEMHDVQFNRKGRYFMRLSVQSLHTADYSDMQLRQYPQKQFSPGHETKSDTIIQDASLQLCILDENSYKFLLPKGFCKNDKNHDVYLQVEAFSLDDGTDLERKVGEAKFAIYPRTNAPRINVTVSRGENMYHYTSIMTLLRTVSTENLFMHCGRLRCTVSLREAIPYNGSSTTPRTPDQEIVRSKTPVKSRNDTQVSFDKGSQTLEPMVNSVDKMSLISSETVSLAPSPPAPQREEYRMMVESPLPSSESGRVYRYLPADGKEVIECVIHGASSLPSTPSGGVPIPYAVLKLKSNNGPAEDKGKTHATLRPTHTPSWEEMISVDVDRQAAEDEVLMLSVADKNTKECLVNYQLPISYLQPFHQYHLELVRPSSGSGKDVRMFATLMRKQSSLQKDASSPNYTGLEILLCGVQKPLSNPIGPLLAVARLVPNLQKYKSRYLTNRPPTARVSMTSVCFPGPHPSSFHISSQQSQGYPQISLAGKPERQPEWNHTFLFCDERDKSAMFVPGAGLVIEYYAVNLAMSDDFWKMESPVGHSSIPMDQIMYQQLSAGRASNGLYMEGLPIENTELIAENHAVPTVGTVLRLLTTSKPDSLVSVSNLDGLPHFEAFPTGNTGEYYRDTVDILTVTPVDEYIRTPTPEPPAQPRMVARKIPKRRLSVSSAIAGKSGE